MNKRSHGFTLVELLVTVTIAGISAALAVPAYQSFVQDTRVSSQANDFLASLNYTRSEAVKRNTRVTMCKSGNGTACVATSGASTSWKAGWMIFVDGATAGAYDSTDTILRVRGALADGDLVGDANVRNYVSYASNGQASMADGSRQVGTFSLCSNSATVKRRKIVLAQGTGWVGITTVAGSATCTS